MTDRAIFIDAAREARVRGYGIVWLLPGEKMPKRTGWTLASQSSDDYRPGSNLGLMTGKISSGLVCVDLDSADALRLADRFLPATRMIDGRDSKPRSHRWFLARAVPPSLVSTCTAAQHLGGGSRIVRYAPKILDLLATGAQAVVPPSVHESGERREWVGGCMSEPAIVDCAELYAAVERLARACGWTPKPVLPPPSRPRFFAHRGDAQRRAINYVRKMPPAISGSGGHNATMAAARVVTWGFDLGARIGFEILADHFNPRCLPPWSERELRHKVDDADTKPCGRPRGWLLERQEVGAR